MRLNLKTGSLAVAVATSVVIGLGTYEAHGHFSKKIKQQRQLVGKMLQFRSTYEDLLPTNDQWNRLFAPVNADTDVLGIHQKMGLMDIGIGSSPDDLRVASVSPEKANGQQLKLYKACMTNGGNNFSFVANTPAQALSITRRLALRRDMAFKEIVLDQDRNGLIEVRIGELCFYLREDEKGA